MYCARFTMYECEGKCERLSIHYEVIGDGYPVVMLHGWTLDHHVLMHAMEPVFEKRSGWQRIYIDLPGMGRSKPQPSIQNSDDMLDAVLHCLQNMIPDEPFIVCGNSYGGYIAQGIVRYRQPWVRGMMLLAPMIIPEFDDRAVPQQTILKRDDALVARLAPDDAEEFTSIAVLQGQREWERFQNEILRPSKQSHEEFLHRIRQNGYGFSFDLSSVTLRYPTLIITGRQDHVVGYQDAARLLTNYPRATFAVLDRAGHNLQIEQPDIFATLVQDWLTRLEAEIRPD